MSEHSDRSPRFSTGVLARPLSDDCYKTEQNAAIPAISVEEHERIVAEQVRFWQAQQEAAHTEIVNDLEAEIARRVSVDEVIALLDARIVNKRSLISQNLLPHAEGVRHIELLQSVRAALLDAVGRTPGATE